MKHLKLCLLSLILCTITKGSYAQTAEVKINVLSAAATIFNPSLEAGFGKSSAITFDYVGAFARENFMNTGYPFLFSMGTFGYRYYTSGNSHKGFFVGGDFGFDQFRMNKNIIPLVTHDHSNSGYDVGFGYFVGATVGYKYQISSRFNVEASISGGWHRAQHECYNSQGVRTVTLNPSGEWTPYKAGIYLSYKLW